VYSNNQDKKCIRKCNITSRWWSIIPSGQALPLIKVCSFHNTTRIKRVLSVPTDWPHFLSYTSASSIVSLQHRCTHLGYNNAQVASFCTAAPNICESSACDMFHGTILTHKIRRYLPDFENFRTPELSHTVLNTAKQMIQKSEPLLHIHTDMWLSCSDNMRTHQ